MEDKDRGSLCPMRGISTVSPKMHPLFDNKWPFFQTDEINKLLWWPTQWIHLEITSTQAAHNSTRDPPRRLLCPSQNRVRQPLTSLKENILKGWSMTTICNDKVTERVGYLGRQGKQRWVWCNMMWQCPMGVRTMVTWSLSAIRVGHHSEINWILSTYFNFNSITELQTGNSTI